MVERVSRSILSRISRFAASPQGRRALAQAQRLARDPATRRRLDDARRRLSRRRRKAV